MLKDKGMVAGILVTFLLIIGGVFYFTKDNSASPQNPIEVSQDLLVSPSSYKTSGIVNGNYIEASESAKVTLIEFGDFQCPACALYHPLIKQLLQEYPGKITFVFRNFPLSQHKNADISAYSAEAAGLQGKYWQMYSKLFETQSSWSGSNTADEIFIEYAKELGLNVDKFKSDLESKEIKNKINADIADGNLIKLNSTPTYYLNGAKLESLPSTYEGLKSIVERELNK